MLHIFDTLSTADIRFLSVDVSEQHSDTATPPSHSSSAAHQSVDHLDVARWRKIIEREKSFQNEWRDELLDQLFKSSNLTEMVLELPQIWAVTENPSSPATLPDSFKSFHRVALCKVTDVIILFHASLQSESSFLFIFTNLYWQDYADFKTLISQIQGLDELDEFLWERLVHNMFNATASANPETPRPRFYMGGGFGDLTRRPTVDMDRAPFETTEKVHKSQALLLNSWQPNGKARTCHMQTMTINDGSSEPTDVKVYWNKLSPPGWFEHTAISCDLSPDHMFRARVC